MTPTRNSTGQAILGYNGGAWAIENCGWWSPSQVRRSLAAQISFATPLPADCVVGSTTYFNSEVQVFDGHVGLGLVTPQPNPGPCNTPWGYRYEDSVTCAGQTYLRTCALQAYLFRPECSVRLGVTMELWRRRQTGTFSTCDKLLFSTGLQTFDLRAGPPLFLRSTTPPNCGAAFSWTVALCEAFPCF